MESFCDIINKEKNGLFSWQTFVETELTVWRWVIKSEVFDNVIYSIALSKTLWRIGKSEIVYGVNIFYAQVYLIEATLKPLGKTELAIHVLITLVEGGINMSFTDLRLIDDSHI